mmetsp:Transcript_31083/g.59980  ORF Transcript_31083/g.59980 Transcript_31083/m.59980 type:complete len:829 (+) Transcript_31083:2-2488(+)
MEVEEEAEDEDDGEEDDEAERVLAHRSVEGADESAVTDPWKLREFYVKWKRYSHMHNCWDSYTTLAQLGGFKRVLAYIQKMEAVESAARHKSPEELEMDAITREMEQELLHEHVKVSRVVSERVHNGKTQYLVLWRGLPYKDCTWEDVTHRPFIEHETAQPAIDAFQRRESRAMVVGQTVGQARALWRTNKQPLRKQPAYLNRAGMLRDYQLEGVNWLLYSWGHNTNGVLADEMGLGKTVQVVSFLSHLRSKGVLGPYLVVGPLSTLPNWVNEFKRWTPDVPVLLYHGTQAERAELRRAHMPTRATVDEHFPVVCTSYEIIIRDRKFLQAYHWKYLVVDEGHRLKNDKSRLAETLRTCYDFKHRLLITGTPINNNLQELWALLNFILPNIFNSADSFDEWFAKPFQGMNSGSGDDEVLSEEEVQLIIHRLHNVLRPFLLRRKKDEVETGLPEKTDFVIFCDLSAWQKLYYQQVIMKRNVHNKSLNNTAMQLRKICNHPYLLMDEEDDLLTAEDRLRASGKFFMLARLLEKLKATGHRVLLFSQMVKALDIVQDFLEDSSYSFLRLDGKTKPEERVGQVDAWNEDDSPYFIFILSTRAGGLGLNLQTADTVIILDSDWNPQQDLQAECRAHRIGQTKPVRVLTLASKGTIDEWILKRAGEKKLIDNKVIQAGMFNNQSSMEDRQELLQDIMQEGMQLNLTSEDLPTDDEVNQAVARSDEEFLLFQQMDLDLDKSLAQRSMERLMQHKEIPRVVTEDVEKEEELELEQNTIEGILGTEEFGRGKRRAAVNYSEEETKGSRKRDRNEQDEADDAPRRVSRRPRKHIKAGDS